MVMSSELEDVFGSMMVGRVSFANFFVHDTGNMDSSLVIVMST